MNNLNNPILLLFRHLVITRQTKSTPENINSYVHSRAFYVSICAPSAITLNRNKRIGPVDRLHMHWLNARFSNSWKCNTHSNTILHILLKRRFSPEMHLRLTFRADCNRLIQLFLLLIVVFSHFLRSIYSKPVQQKITLCAGCQIFSSGRFPGIP